MHPIFYLIIGGLLLAGYTFAVIRNERNLCKKRVSEVHQAWRHFLGPNSIDHIAPDGKTLTDPDTQATFTQRPIRSKSVRFEEARD